MASIIEPSTDSPVLTGLLVNNIIITANSRIGFESDIREMFQLFVPWGQSRVEPGHTLFSTTGWNSVFFYTPTPILCSNYAVWFSEDYKSGSRATSCFRLYTSMSNILTSYTLVDSTIMYRPYHYEKNYGTNAIKVSNSIGPITAQYFQLMFQACDWGTQTDGPRVNGFQIT